MKNLLTLNFWFNTRPGDYLTSSLIALGIFSVLLLIGAFAIKAYQKKNPKTPYRKVLSMGNAFCWTNFILGIFLLFFAYETVMFLSARFWFLLWLISMVAWVAVIVKKAKEVPLIREKIEEQKNFKKYIP